MAVGLGRGSSLKYLWLKSSLAVGRLEGFKDRRLSSKDAPAFVRIGNLERTTLPVAPRWLLGRRSERAFGRRLKPGQISSVGMPQSSKICTLVNYTTRHVYLLGPVCLDWVRNSPCLIGRLRSCLAVADFS
jgi:hypothetical protein